jgi:nuclear pore complex protein Nup155
MNRMDKERLFQQILENCKQIPARINLSPVCQQLSAFQYSEALWTLLRCGGEAGPSPPRLAVLQDPAAVEAFLAYKNCYQQMYQTGLICQNRRPNPADY